MGRHRWGWWGEALPSLPPPAPGPSEETRAHSHLCLPPQLSTADLTGAKALRAPSAPDIFTADLAPLYLTPAASETTLLCLSLQSPPSPPHSSTSHNLTSSYTALQLACSSLLPLLPPSAFTILCSSRGTNSPNNLLTPLFCSPICSLRSQAEYEYSS